MPRTMETALPDAWLPAASCAHHCDRKRRSGTVLAGSSVTTGIVSSALVTPSPVPTTVILISPAQSLPLTTPASSPGMGRNGFLEASRISTSDVSPTPSPFDTTTSVASAVTSGSTYPIRLLLERPRRWATTSCFAYPFPEPAFRTVGRLRTKSRSCSTARIPDDC